jgi:ADP-ribose pyrophosphatase YjhB (NUDIX family)
MNNKNTKQVECAGGIVINDKQEVVIVNQNHDSYSLPKGHVDPGENYLETAKREIYEETGIKSLEYIKDLGSYSRYRIGLDGTDDKSEMKTIFIFLFQTNQVDLDPIDPNNPFALWINYDRVNEYLTHKEDKLFYNNTLKLWVKK